MFFLSTGVSATDLNKEKRWAEQVVDAIMDGEAIWLDDGSSQFLGVYTESEEDSDRAVIIMHGTGNRFTSFWVLEISLGDCETNHDFLFDAVFNILEFIVMRM